MPNEDKSARYHRLRRRASLVAAAWWLVFLSGLLLTGAATALRVAVESFAGSGLVPLVPIYVLALAGLFELVQLPLAFYLGVALERRYDLSTVTTARWWTDHAKAAALSLACLTAAALVVSALIRWSPNRWWVFAAACFSATLVLVARFAPVVLLPLFHEVTPLSSQALRARLLTLADRAGAPVLDVFQWRVGDRTRKANAALVGLGRTRRILVSDTLIEGHTDDEIEAVLAHELAHHVYGDIWSTLVLQAALVALGCYLADAVLTSWGGTFGLEGKADVAGLPLVALCGGAVPVALTPMANALSRAHERRADRYALDLTRNRAAFISAMTRLAALNLAEERPSLLVEVLFHSHPSTAARIAAARAWTARSTAPGR